LVTTPLDQDRRLGSWVREPAAVVALVLLGGLFCFRLANFRSRWFNPDELEHVHVSWCVAKGMVPYRDFFEHHTPWLWYLLAPLVAGERVASDTAAAVQALTLARATSLVFSAAALGALVWLGRIWNGALCGAVSALCLAGMRIFFDKTTEIRPDVGSLLLWIGSLVGLAYALRGTDRREGRRGPFLATGLCLGAAIMFQQKMLFVVPGLGLVGLLWIALGSPGSVRLARLRAATWLVVGACVPLAVTWGYFAARGAGWDFFNWNFLLNARWKSGETREPWLQQMAIDDWPILLLAAGGVATWLWALAGTRRCDWLGLVLIASGVSVLLGLLVIPVAWSQYYLPLLPLLALFAARFVVLAGGRLPARLRWIAIVPILLLLQIKPVTHALSVRDWRNDGQLNELAYVFAKSAPSDPVLDGWRGLGMFRPHAWYWFCLPADVRTMIPPAELAAFLDDLETGRVRPKLAVADFNLAGLSPRLVAFIRAHYTYGAYDIWIRRPDL
jgi:hypothetical protein